VSVECVGGRRSVVTGLGSIGERGEDRQRKCMRRSRKSGWEGGEWIVAQEKEGM
jgi:hypothetical protein